jgi:hypothetical protein
LIFFELLEVLNQFITVKIVAATIPAVSVLNLVSPRDTGIKLFCNAISISSFVKSPSGPMAISRFDDLVI